MSQSLAQLFIHIVFHIKTTSVNIRTQDKDQLYSYMGSIINDNGPQPIIINGTEDHVHILCVMSKNVSLAKLVEKIKRHSSRWIKTKNVYYLRFAWQGGYAGFSVSPSLVDKTKKYIVNQEEHHYKLSFKEEYQLFLIEYGLDYNKEYIWRD